VHDSEIFPRTVEQIVEPSDSIDDLSRQDPLHSINKRSYRSLLIGGSFVAAAALVAGSIVGLKMSSEAPKNAVPHKDPSETSQTPSVAPSEVATQTPNISELIAAQEIKTGQTPDALGLNVITMINSLTMSGIDTFTADWNVEVAKTGDASDVARVAYADKYAKKQFTEIYGPAVFDVKEGDVVDPELQKVFDGLIAVNSNNIQLNWLTSHETTPFISKRAIDTPVQIISQDNNQLTLSINYTETNNASQNRAGAAYTTSGVPNPNGLKDNLTVTLNSKNTTEKITVMKFSPRT
jgi:hypothetical protein